MALCYLRDKIGGDLLDSLDQSARKRPRPSKSPKHRPAYRSFCPRKEPRRSSALPWPLGEGGRSNSPGDSIPDRLKSNRRIRPQSPRECERPAPQRTIAGSDSSDNRLQSDSRLPATWNAGSSRVTLTRSVVARDSP